jgi:FtsH-binding integral membrane protein
MKKIKIISLLLALSIPSITFAEPLSETSKILSAMGNLVGKAIPIVFALALLLFFWCMAMYIYKSGAEKDEGKKIMVWGVVALFVMSSIWGLVKFIQVSFGLDITATTQKIPTFSP